MASSNKHSATTRLLVGAAVAAFSFAQSVACTRHDSDFTVTVTRADGAGVPSAENLTIFVGASKSWWPTVAAGETVSVVLPTQGEPPQMTMIYTVAGRRHDWRGPALSQGGYRVAISIPAEGSATEHHCRLPCTLP